MRRKVTILLLGVLLLTLPAAAKDVGSRYDKNADFTSYKAYKWAQDPEKPRGPRVSPGGDLDVLIRGLVEGHLAAKGLEATEDADLNVSYEAVAVEVLDIEPVSNYEARRQTPLGGIDWVMDGTMKSYYDGTLVITLEDAETGKPVWSAWTSEKIKDVQNPEKQVTKLVKKLLSKFPPKK